MSERHRLGRRMSLRFGVTAIDQGISSLSNFAVGAAIARISGVAALGAYALAYAAWLLVGSFHRSLVTDPMNIENDLNTGDAARNVRLGLSGELALGVSAGAVGTLFGVVLLFVLHQHEYGLCFVALFPWLPCLLAQDFWRWVGFMKAEPRKALANDVLFVVVQGATFAALYAEGMRSVLLAIISWGLGATAGAVYGCWQHRTAPGFVGGVARIRQRWHFTRWLVATNLVATATAQSTLVLTGLFLGPAGLGGLKSALNLVSGPSRVPVQAATSVGLPEASKQLARRGWPGLRRVERWVTVVGVLTLATVALAILLFGRDLLDLVYGHAFGRFAKVTDIVAVSYLVTSLGHGAILSLKTTRQTRRFVPVCAISLSVSIASVATLAPAFGLTGAAVANLIGNVTRTAGFLVAHLRSSKRSAEALVPDPSRLDPALGPALPPALDAALPEPVPPDAGATSQVEVPYDQDEGASTNGQPSLAEQARARNIKERARELLDVAKWETAEDGDAILTIPLDRWQALDDALRQSTARAPRQPALRPSRQPSQGAS